MAPLLTRRDNIRYRRFTFLEIPDGLLIVPHVGVIQETYQTDGASTMKEKISCSIEFQIFRPCSSQIGIKENAISYFGHHRFTKSSGEPMIVVLDDGRVGISAGVRGIVVGAVVVHRPIQKLQVAVGSVSICIEEIDQAHFANAKFQASRGKRGGQTERAALG